MAPFVIGNIQNLFIQRSSLNIMDALRHKSFFYSSVYDIYFLRQDESSGFGAKNGRNLDESGGFWSKNGQSLDFSAELA